MQREKNLVILAAGLGTRFKGGIKQLQSVGPGGECIMEYSIYDALEAGFNRVVFIIRHDIEEVFNEAIGNRVLANCAKRGVEVVCAYQEKEDLPGGYQCPAERVKPWGTGHALLCCRGLLHGGFVVINADDYYGKESFRKISRFLDEAQGGVYALAGFLLENTLSDYGTVTRGLCRTDGEDWLIAIRETKHVAKAPDGPVVETADGLVILDGKTPVSMNMWGFTLDILDLLEKRFVEFLGENLETEGSEFLLPTEIGGMLTEEDIRVKVLPAPDRWFGMTYAADIPTVKASLQKMADDGVYPTPLF